MDLRKSRAKMPKAVTDLIAKFALIADSPQCSSRSKHSGGEDLKDAQACESSLLRLSTTVSPVQQQASSLAQGVAELVAIACIWSEWHC